VEFLHVHLAKRRVKDINRTIVRFDKNYTHAGWCGPWVLTLSAPPKQHRDCTRRRRYVARAPL
jgi:hypothetical protein